MVVVVLLGPRVVLWSALFKISSIWPLYPSLSLTLLPFYLSSLSSGFDSIDCPYMDSERNSAEFRSWMGCEDTIFMPTTEYNDYGQDSRPR